MPQHRLLQVSCVFLLTAFAGNASLAQSIEADKVIDSRYTYLADLYRHFHYCSNQYDHAA